MVFVVFAVRNCAAKLGYQFTFRGTSSLLAGPVPLTHKTDLKLFIGLISVIVSNYLMWIISLRTTIETSILKWSSENGIVMI